ncbi:MAG: hypothetical protein WC222_04450 [Parachlamydiales bacterium]|jgi:hypothetical protein
MLHLTQHKSSILIEPRPQKNRISKIFFLALLITASLHCIPLILFTVESQTPPPTSNINLLHLAEISSSTPMKIWNEPLPYPSFLQ